MWIKLTALKGLIKLWEPSPSNEYALISMDELPVQELFRMLKYQQNVSILYSQYFIAYNYIDIFIWMRSRHPGGSLSTGITTEIGSSILHKTPVNMHQT